MIGTITAKDRTYIEAFLPSEHKIKETHQQQINLWFSRFNKMFAVNVLRKNLIKSKCMAGKNVTCNLFMAVAFQVQLPRTRSARKWILLTKKPRKTERLYDVGWRIVTQTRVVICSDELHTMLKPNPVLLFTYSNHNKWPNIYMQSWTNATESTIFRCAIFLWILREHHHKKGATTKEGNSFYECWFAF